MAKDVSTALARSAAALFVSACRKDAPSTAAPHAGTAAPIEPASDAKIKCFGVNECSGQGACNVPDGRVAEGSKRHACAGQNECAGKGWILLTRVDCEAAGGEDLWSSGRPRAIVRARPFVGVSSRT